jgi:16S rRNA (uracil1498-N3)-methyltransferase
MHRFYCPQKNIFKDKIIIDDLKELHHLKDVLRLKIGDKVTLFDEKGNEYICLIKEFKENLVILQILDKRSAKTGKIKINVATAIPKKSKMDDIIDKLTQLGVDRIIPLETQRVIVKLDQNKKISRHLRWEKIAQSAAQQSHRCTLPVIEPIRDIAEFLSDSAVYDLKLIPTLTGKRKNLKDIFAKTKAKNILVLIGPEGDFTPEEVTLAKKSACIPVSLGDSVLRVETAAIAAVSFIKLYFMHRV